MRLLNRLAAWWTRAPRARSPRSVKRARELRAFYLEHLSEETHSLDERVAYHLYHLQIYWTRCMGFMESGFDTGIDGDLIVMAEVGTELSDADVREHCRERGDAELLEAWEEYEHRLRGVRDRVRDFTTRAHEAAAHFARVDALRKARGLLHRFEARR